MALNWNCLVLDFEKRKRRNFIFGRNNNVDHESILFDIWIWNACSLRLLLWAIDSMCVCVFDCFQWYTYFVYFDIISVNRKIILLQAPDEKSTININNSVNVDETKSIVIKLSANKQRKIALLEKEQKSTHSA